VDGILEAVNERTRIIFIASPNNPTGTIVTRKQMDKLLAHLPPEVIVIYDEVYHHYVKNADHARAIDYIKQSYPVIGLHSFSKAYGLAGLRLGYAFSRPDLSDYLQQLRRPFMINSLAVEAGIAALSDHEHLEQTVELVISEKQWLYQELRRLCIPFTPSHANYILFKAPYEAVHFAADMLQGGVMVRTADVFGAEGCIRVTIGTREAGNAFIKLLKLLI
jgi:histidinol-phosphate aminotransferase